jgi:hypothetical protein
MKKSEIKKWLAAKENDLEDIIWFQSKCQTSFHKWMDDNAIEFETRQDAKEDFIQQCVKRGWL